MNPSKLADWQEIDQQLVRHFEFKDFIEAFGFLAKVAILAEKQNHHPVIENVYNKVTLRLSTHDAGDIVTKKDYKLAEAINAVL